MISLIRAAPGDGKRFGLGVRGSVRLLAPDNSTDEWAEDERVIADDRAFIILPLRHDLLSIDFDDVPVKIIESFLDDNLVERPIPFLLIPSGSGYRQVPEGRGRSFHLHVITSSPAEKESLRRAVETLGTTFVEPAAPSAERAQVHVLNAVRAPLSAHRSVRETARIREYTAAHPSVYSTILEVFEAPSLWARDAHERSHASRQSRVAGDRPPNPVSVDLKRIEPRYRKLLDGSSRDRYSIAGRAVALTNHLEARGFDLAEIWALRHRFGFAGYLRDQYDKPLSEKEGWRRLTADFENAKRTRAEQCSGVGLQSRIGILRAALLHLETTDFKIAAVCIDVMDADGVQLGHARLGEKAGISSPRIVVEHLRRLTKKGWIVPLKKGTFGRRGDLFAFDVPAKLRPKGKDIVIHSPPEARRHKRILADLRALVATCAFRARGLRPAVMQIILADWCGIDRRKLPIGERTLRRTMSEMQDLGLLDERGRCIKKLVLPLAEIAVERGLVDAAERQKKRNRNHRVRALTRAIVSSSTPDRELRRLAKEDPALGAEVRHEVQAVRDADRPRRAKLPRRVRTVSTRT